MEATASAIHPNLQPSVHDGDRQQQQQQSSQPHDDELDLSHLPFDPGDHSLGSSAIAGDGSGNNGDDVGLPYPHPPADYQPFAHHDAHHFQSIEQQHAAEFAELLGQHNHGAPGTFELEGPGSSGPGGVGEDDGSGGGHALSSTGGGAVGIDSSGPYVDDDQGGLGLPSFGVDDQDHDQVVNGLIGLAHGHGQPLSVPAPLPPPPAPSRKRKKAPAAPKVDAANAGNSGGEGSQNGQKRTREQVRNACTNCQKTRKKCSGDRPCASCLRNPSGNPCVDSSRKKRPVGIKRGKYKTKNRKADDESADGQAMDGNAVAGPSHLGLHAHGSVSDNLHQSESGQQHLDQHEDAYTLYTHSTIDPSLDDPAGSSEHHHHHHHTADAESGNPDDEYTIDESTLAAVVEQAQAEARAQHSRAGHGPNPYIGGGGGSRQTGPGPEQEVDPHLMSLRLPSDHLPDPQASPSTSHVSPLPPPSDHARHSDRGPSGRPIPDDDVSLAFLQQLGAATHAEGAQGEDMYEPIPPDEQPQLDVGSGGPDEYEVIPEHDGADGDVDHADEQAVREALGR